MVEREMIPAGVDHIEHEDAHERRCWARALHPAPAHAGAAQVESDLNKKTPGARHRGFFYGPGRLTYWKKNRYIAQAPINPKAARIKGMAF